ncbi:MAG: carboxypeptidase regulatory-like domain-containing protein [SAR202 cluster bacterium]|nr:carboxypeptidase regulatory-like domain-containing protein [SAR202 cluster bacterium]
MNKRRLLPPLALLTLALVLLLPPYVARAQAAGLSVEGKVVNGTADGDPVEGLTVVFHQESPTQHTHLEADADAAGHFRFDGIAFDAATSYGVSVDYKGTIYGMDLDLSGDSPGPIQVSIFEPLQDDSILEATGVSILFAQTDKASKTIWVLEIVQLRNSSDRAYVPGPQPMQLMRFGLPPGASDLEVDTSIRPADIFQVELGFALSASVPPGAHEVLYGYKFPYSDAAYLLEKNLPYGAGQLRVVAPEGVLDFTGGPLGSPQPTSIGGQSYQVLEVNHVPKGTRIALELTGLPQPSFGERVGRAIDSIRWELAAPVALGVLLTAVVGLVLLRARRSRAPGLPETEQVSVASEREAVLGMIAGLDREKEGGLVAEEDYRRRRGLLTKKLVEMRRQEQELSDEG